MIKHKKHYGPFHGLFYGPFHGCIFMWKLAREMKRIYIKVSKQSPSYFFGEYIKSTEESNSIHLYVSWFGL